MGDATDEPSEGLDLLGDDEDSALVPNRRAAVIVGVGTSAGLQRLSSAGPMVRSLGNWLSTTSPGYDVTVITDEDGHQVTRAEIFKAIRKYVTVPVRYELLLVHYIGHGLYQARNDIWMLSDLPVDRAACVSLTATLNDAKFCGIPNVVVVSDACRVLPGEVELSEVDASSIIPQYPEFPVETSCVDYFQATGRGTPAFEGEIEGVRRSFLSHAFREAYRHPRPDMVSEILSAQGDTIQVVPNRRLGAFLIDEVARNLGEADAAKSQMVVPVVPSDDKIFIAPIDVEKAANAKPAPPPHREERRKGPTPRVYKSKSLARRGISPRRIPSKPVAYDSGVPKLLSPETTITRLIRSAKSGDWPEGQDPRLRFAPPSGPAPQSVPDFETQTGLTLTGAGIARAAMTNWPVTGSFAKSASENDGAGLSVLRLLPAAPVGELALQLKDRRSLLLPVMEGYICHVALDATGVQSLAFVPARSSWRTDGPYPNREPEIERLRALATEAMDANRFQIGSAEEATKLADAIRIGKAFDPILGLLAAQAYSEAAMPDRVRSVSEYMQFDISADLFDVRLLSNRFWRDDLPAVPVTPRLPMLTQNWALLGSRHANLPEPLARLQPFLTNALWTTFAPGAADILFKAIDEGVL